MKERYPFRADLFHLALAVLVAASLAPANASGQADRPAPEASSRLGAPPAADRVTSSSADTIPQIRVDLGALRADPDRYVGESVRWRVQSIGVQRADSLRSDMPRGEPYLLVRDPGGEAGLVYAMIPPHLLAIARNLAPLQRVEIVGRIVHGSSPLTGHPILELVEIRP